VRVLLQVRQRPEQGQGLVRRRPEPERAQGLLLREPKRGHRRRVLVRARRLWRRVLVRARRLSRRPERAPGRHLRQLLPRPRQALERAQVQLQVPVLGRLVPERVQRREVLARL